MDPEKITVPDWGREVIRCKSNILAYFKCITYHNFNVIELKGNFRWMVFFYIYIFYFILRKNIDEEDFAPALRKKQSESWALNWYAVHCFLFRGYCKIRLGYSLYFLKENTHWSSFSTAHTSILNLLGVRGEKNGDEYLLFLDSVLAKAVFFLKQQCSAISIKYMKDYLQWEIFILNHKWLYVKKVLKFSSCNLPSNKLIACMEH